MFDNLKKDLQHHLSGSFYSTPVKVSFIRFLRSMITPEFRVILNYRICHRLQKKGYRTLAYYYYQRMKRKYHCDISPDCVIGPGIRIVHASDIVIGPAVRIGKDCVLFNGVTLGNRQVGASELQMPVVGNGVLISTGAKVLGAISIGDSSIIGANAVVLNSVEANSVAVGIPAKVRPRQNSSLP